jgi:hypothetical protein
MICFGDHLSPRSIQISILESRWITDFATAEINDGKDQRFWKVDAGKK